MTQTFDNSSSYDNSSYDNSNYDSSPTDFDSSQTDHHLNTDWVDHSQTHDTSGFGVSDASAFDITHCFDSSASHSGHEHSGFETADNHFTSESSSAIIDDAINQHSEVMNVAGIGSHWAHMECSDFSPYTTISDSGRVYRHYGSKSYEYEYVGYVENRHFYNKSHYHIGYVGRDGKVYDDHDHLLGWQCAGKIYDKNGHAVPCSPNTSKGAIGAGAYLLFVQFGGV